MKIESVNTINTNIEVYSDKYVYIQGLLQYEFEDCCIYHWPKKEQSKDNTYLSSIWLYPALNFDFKDETMERWSGKRVVIGGTIKLPEPNLGGFGHMSLWPSEIHVTQIKLHKAWIKTLQIN